MSRLTKYEKETIILTSEGDDTYNVFTFNSGLKRKFRDYAAKHPECCHLESENTELGSATFVIDKARLSIRLTAPYSEERRKEASNHAKLQGINRKFTTEDQAPR